MFHPSQKRSDLHHLLPSRFAAFLVPAAAIVLSSAAYAQFRASIQGTVTDPDGASIPNATLTLTDTDTNHTLTALSNGSGTYNFNALAPDHYKLTATAPGFTEQVISNLALNPEQSNAVNVKLQLSGTATTVDVVGDAVTALDTETASLSGNVDSNQIQHLPTAGRDVFQLVQLAPGVFGDGSQSTGGANNLPGTQGPGGATRSQGIFATENGPQANANGGQYESNGIQIDGISTVSAVWGGTSIITPSEDSVGNVKILSSNYDAENGRFSGAQIEVTSKTGTNEFHGSAFFRAQRPGLNAYQRYNGAGSFDPANYVAGDPTTRGLQRDNTRANQIGGSVGGPILHNRLFAFFAYETQRNNTTVTSTGWFETAAFRAAAPANSIAAKYLNFPGGAVSASSIINTTCAAAGFVEGQNCRTIPGQGLDLGSPLRQPLGAQDLTWRSTTNPGTGSGLDGVADLANFNTRNPTTFSASQYNGRLDADVTKKDHLAFAIYWVPESNVSYQGTTRAYNLFNHNQTNDAYSIIWNHVFSSSLLNEARANDAGYRWNEITSNPQEPFGLPQSTVDTIGTIAPAFFGAPGPSNLNQHTYTYKDIATKITGNHSIKFGGEVTRLYYLNNPTYAARPFYNFFNLWDFLNDAPHAEGGTFDPLTGTPTTNRQDNREDIYGFFVQDDWKAKPNLTLNMGLRYAFYGPLSSKQNNIARVVLGTGAATFTGLSVQRGGNLTDAQKANLGPQFGFAFSPNALHGKAVVRGGFGLNFNQTEISITGNSASNFPNVFNASFNQSSITEGAGGAVTAKIDPRISYSIAPSPTTLFGYPPNPNVITPINAANLPVNGGISLVAYQGRQPTIYTEHFSLDTQIDLGHQFVASVGYQGSTGRHLIVQNQAYAATAGTAIARNPLVNNVQQFVNVGNSNNNSLLVGLKHNLSHGIQFDAEFNYAKTMDTGSGPFYEDPYPFAPRLAYGRSDFNYGKAFKLYGLWQPVLFRGHNLVSKLADGWSVSGIYNIHTGFPYTPTYNVPGGQLYYDGSGYTNLRPASYNGTGGGGSSNRVFEQINGQPNLNYANAGPNQTYFTLPAAPVGTGGGTAPGLPTLPGLSRNSFTGPGYQDVDATITKAFGLPNAKVLGEHAVVEIRADAFNLFNETNLVPGSVGNNILSTNFGQASQGLAGRIVNLQARFSF